jgi:hypothetical protein
LLETLYLGYVIPTTITAIVVLCLALLDQYVAKNDCDEGDPFYKWFVVATVIVYPWFWYLLIQELVRNWKDTSKIS